jgi:hypothetical protein
MLIVKVELHSAITGLVTEIARMRIYNDGGGTRTTGNYVAETMRGRNEDALSKNQTTRKGTVTGYPRLALHVWHLVFEALKSMNYDRTKA